MKMIIHQANGLQIGQRIEDGYINLTKMAFANNKKINDYLRLETTKAFIDELSVVTGIPVSKIIQIKKGRGDRVEQGTWGHPQVAINCGQWCSAKFAALVSSWVFDWMTTGKNPIQRSQSTANATIKNKPDALQLLDQIQYQINHARLFRHTAHNITDQPIFSKNVNRVVHKAMHEQGSILNDCLNTLEDLRELIDGELSQTPAPQQIDLPPALEPPKETEPKPHYQTFVRKEARLTDYQLEQLTILARKLNRQRQGKGERITENTLIRVAVDMLLNNPQELNNLSFLEPPTYNPTPINQPNYLSFNRKETRLTSEQLDELTKLSRRLNQQKQGGDRITENTLIRSAIDLLITQSERLKSKLHRV